MAIETHPPPTFGQARHRCRPDEQNLPESKFSALAIFVRRITPVRVHAISEIASALSDSGNLSTGQLLWKPPERAVPRHDGLLTIFPVVSLRRQGKSGNN